MFKGFSKYLLPSVIALSALSVSVSAAFYSVTGLSKLFAGASTEVIIMAGSLEFSKLVLATLLHQYWGRLGKLLRAYLTSAVVVLIIITSMGIYGFLSAAYQETANKASIVDTRIAFLEQKRDFYQEDVNRYDTELERISDNIATLSQAKSRDIQVRDTTSSTGFRSTISTTELRLAQQRIETEEENRRLVQADRSEAADSLTEISGSNFRC
jgi:Skp family chaperone for outer membrane proteins